MPLVRGTLRAEAVACRVPLVLPTARARRKSGILVDRRYPKEISARFLPVVERSHCSLQGQPSHGGLRQARRWRRVAHQQVDAREAIARTEAEGAEQQRGVLGEGERVEDLRRGRGGCGLRRGRRGGRGVVRGGCGVGRGGRGGGTSGFGRVWWRTCAPSRRAARSAAASSALGVASGGASGAEAKPSSCACSGWG